MQLTNSLVRKANKAYRANCQGHLWPYVSANQVIKRLQYLQRRGLVIDDYYSYVACLNETASQLVNR